MSRPGTALGRFFLFATLCFAMVLGRADAALAHEVPSNVTVRAFIKPEGETLRVLMRVPLASMRDMILPLRENSYFIPSQSDQQIYEAAQVWIASYLSIYENETLLDGESIVAARVTIPTDPSFADYDTALANVLSPRLPDNINLIWDLALLDVVIDYPISSATSDFSIEPLLAHLGVRTTTILTFMPPDSPARVFQYIGDPGLVRLDPRWHQAALTFVHLGFLHILEGIDHLLFIFCLVIPFRRVRPLIAVVTSFTVAHSITLMAATFGLAPDALWFPPLIEMLIALSIVYMALENIVGANVERRWVMAFGFGLIHGFGFSFLLTESLQFAGGHLIASLLAFNVGVEIGQIVVLLITVPVLAFFLGRYVPERTGTIILSALVAHTAWHWMSDRWSTLREYQYQWPALDAALAATAMRWAMLALIVIAVGWGLSEAFGKLIRRGPDKEAPANLKG
jgi:hypothetical protein